MGKSNAKKARVKTRATSVPTAAAVPAPTKAVRRGRRLLETTARRTAAPVRTANARKHRKDQRSQHQLDWSEPAPVHLVARLDVPKLNSKYHSYFEFAENTEKKKKLEFLITNDSNPPAGYEFVPVGHPRLTNECKEISRERDALIFVVSRSKEVDTSKISAQIYRSGYHFREHIVAEAKENLGDVTFATYGPGTIEPIPDSQAEINKQADGAIRDLFPRIPNTDREAIIQHAFQKGATFNGEPTVGLQHGLSLSRRVQLAVLAHIRHTHTRYDQLLRETSWINARKVVEPVCLDILVTWRGDEETGRDQLDEILREVVIITDSEDEDDVMSDNELVETRNAIATNSPESNDDVISISSDEHEQSRKRAHSAQVADLRLSQEAGFQRSQRHIRVDKDTDPPRPSVRTYSPRRHVASNPLHGTRQRGFRRYQAAWNDAVSRQRHPGSPSLPSNKDTRGHAELPYSQPSRGYFMERNPALERPVHDLYRMTSNFAPMHRVESGVDTSRRYATNPSYRGSIPAAAVRDADHVVPTSTFPYMQYALQDMLVPSVEPDVDKTNEHFRDMQHGQGYGDLRQQVDGARVSMADHHHRDDSKGHMVRSDDATGNHVPQEPSFIVIRSNATEYQQSHDARRESYYRPISPRSHGGRTSISLASTSQRPENLQRYETLRSSGMPIYDELELSNGRRSRQQPSTPIYLGLSMADERSLGMCCRPPHGHLPERYHLRDHGFMRDPRGIHSPTYVGNPGGQTVDRPALLPFHAAGADLRSYPTASSFVPATSSSYERGEGSRNAWPPHALSMSAGSVSHGMRKHATQEDGGRISYLRRLSRGMEEPPRYQSYDGTGMYANRASPVDITPSDAARYAQAYTNHGPPGPLEPSRLRNNVVILD